MSQAIGRDSGCSAMPVSLKYRVGSTVKGFVVKIGEVAKRAGVTVDTVRFYERSGILPRAPRTESGYRDHPEGTAERILLAKQLQSIGLTLDEITEALRSHHSGKANCQTEMWRLERALERIEQRLADLESTRSALKSVMEACRSGDCRLVVPSGSE
jgi:DNA-binding transcriptional MerR regulator